MDETLGVPALADPDTVGGGVGSTRLHLRGMYLTAHDRSELLRVAGGNTEPVERVVSIVEKSHRTKRSQFRWMGAFLALDVVWIAAGLVAPWLYWTVGVASMVAGIGLLVAVAREDARWDDLIVSALMRVVRELEHPRWHYGRVCHLLREAANAFAEGFRVRRDEPRRWRTWWRRVPSGFKGVRRDVAERGAVAIASQAYRLECDTPDPQGVADDLRRAVLRVASAHWRQVAELDVTGDQPALWKPGLGRRISGWTQHNPTAVIAIVALAVTVAFGILNGTVWHR